MWSYVVNLFDEMRSWSDVLDVLHYVLKMAVTTTSTVAIPAILSFTAYKAVRLYMDSLDLADSAVRGTLPDRKLRRRMQLVYEAKKLVEEIESNPYRSNSDMQKSISAVGRVVNKIQEEL